MPSPRPLTFEIVDPHSEDGARVLVQYYTDIVGRYWGRAATPAETESAMLDEPSDHLRGDGGFLVLVRDGADAVGCGGVRIVEQHVGELTRIYLDPVVRGRGAGRALLSELEAISIRRGIRTLRLTVRQDLVEAHGLYRRSGYEPVEAFSTSPYADHFLAKELAPLERAP
ncbi:GNAT family N-acetyltransferase [Microbacterium sp. LTA6]|uniref:GNAT family N-acetyltransferase n=1 Tax=Microbacterium sp. LTA6 TaxID=3129771 RepID=UPI0032526E16